MVRPRLSKTGKIDRTDFKVESWTANPAAVLAETFQFSNDGKPLI